MTDTVTAMTLAEMEAIFADPDVLSVQLDVEFGDCDRRIVTDRGELINLAHLTVEQVGMKKYDKPIVKTYHFGEDRLGGTTVIQLITTSNVDIHGFDDSRACELTLNSCQAYDVAAALAFLSKALGSDTYTYGVRVRRIPRQRR